jgi:hypothetical protein
VLREVAEALRTEAAAVLRVGVAAVVRDDRAAVLREAVALLRAAGLAVRLAGASAEERAVGAAARLAGAAFVVRVAAVFVRDAGAALARVPVPAVLVRLRAGVAALLVREAAAGVRAVRLGAAALPRAGAAAFAGALVCVRVVVAFVRLGATGLIARVGVFVRRCGAGALAREVAGAAFARL